jgi:hypothetical protein
MPNPLSKVMPNGTVIGGPGALGGKPLLCALIMRVINAWSYNDVTFLRMLSGFLKADFGVVSAMFQAVKNSEAKQAALMAAARKISAPDDLALILAVIRITKASRKRRNDFAHHYWAECVEIDNALVLIDPAVIVEHHVAYYEHILTDQKPRADFPRADKNKVFVFTEADLWRDVEEAEQAEKLISMLENAVSQVAPDGQMRDQLLKEPLVQEALASPRD